MRYVCVYIYIFTYSHHNIPLYIVYIHLISRFSNLNQQIEKDLDHFGLVFVFETWSIYS